MIVAAVCFYLFTGYTFVSLVRVIASLSKQPGDFSPLMLFLGWPFLVVVVVVSDIVEFLAVEK